MLLYYSFICWHSYNITHTERKSCPNAVGMKTVTGMPNLSIYVISFCHWNLLTLSNIWLWLHWISRRARASLSINMVYYNHDPGYIPSPLYNLCIMGLMKTPVFPDSCSAFLIMVSISHGLFFGGGSWWVPFSKSYIIKGLEAPLPYILAYSNIFQNSYH